MAVSFSRTGPNLTVTITQDVADLAGNSTATRNDKVVTALNRCVVQLQAAITAQPGTADLDTRIAQLQADKAALPSPIGSF